MMCDCPACMYRLRCTVLVLCGTITWRFIEGEGESVESSVLIEKVAQLAAQWASLTGERLVVS